MLLNYRGEREAFLLGSELDEDYSRVELELD